MSKTLNPFSGYPATHEGTTKDGDKRYVVSLAATGPWGAKFRDYLTYGSTAMSAVVALGFATYASELPTLSRLAVCVVPVPAFFGFRGIFEWALATRASVVFIPLNIRVRKFIFTKTYDRSHNIKFTMRKHERAERHAKIIEHRRAKRRVFPERNYYESSYRIFTEVLGQSFPIMTVYGLNRATRITARLNAIHQTIDSAAGRGAGVALVASHDWADSAGELS